MFWEAKLKKSLKRIFTINFRRIIKLIGIANIKVKKNLSQRPKNVRKFKKYKSKKIVSICCYKNLLVFGNKNIFKHEKSTVLFRTINIH